MQDQEFVSELLFVVLKGEVDNGDTNSTLDNKYKEWSEKINAKNFKKYLNEFKEVMKCISDFNIDFNKKKVENRLNDFYTKLRNGDTNPLIEDYRLSMQSRTKSKSQREKRLNALKEYCR